MRDNMGTEFRRTVEYVFEFRSTPNRKRGNEMSETTKKRYRVHVKRMREFTVQVFADNKAEAMEIAEQEIAGELHQPDEDGRVNIWAEVLP